MKLPAHSRNPSAWLVWTGQVLVAFLFGLAATTLPGAEPEPYPFAAALTEAGRAHSIYLKAGQKQQVVRTFTTLVAIPSPSGSEARLQDHLRQRLAAMGASEIQLTNPDARRANNLVMEFPASPSRKEQPAILLNAHLDTIRTCAPEGMRYDSATGDFYHEAERNREQSSSFGADDKVGITVIIETLALLQTNFWASGTAHRRVLAVFTAEEEIGCQGASLLAKYYPSLFDPVEISLTFDGPIDYHSNYPREAFMAVISSADAQREPYRRVLDLMRAFCQQAKTSFGRTEIGLGMGDFGRFPATAHAGLHVRSPQRGFHSVERVKVGDLINHVDLLGFLLLNYDKSFGFSPGENRAYWAGNVETRE